VSFSLSYSAARTRPARFIPNSASLFHTEIPSAIPSAACGKSLEPAISAHQNFKYFWLGFPMPPADRRFGKPQTRAPRKNRPSVVAFINPRPQLQSITTLISIQQTPRKKQNPRGHSRVFALPISNGASPIASALGIRLGATPREHIHPNSQHRNLPIKQDISTLPGSGHFYFALTAEIRMLQPKSFAHALVGGCTRRLGRQCCKTTISSRGSFGSHPSNLRTR